MSTEVVFIIRLCKLTEEFDYLFHLSNNCIKRLLTIKNKTLKVKRLHANRFGKYEKRKVTVSLTKSELIQTRTEMAKNYEQLNVSPIDIQKALNFSPLDLKML